MPFNSERLGKKEENLTKETKKQQPAIEEGTADSENEGRFEKY